jgi:FtsH-binding integral membrane protein
MAGLGLGGFAFALWAQRYRWVFLVLTFALLGVAFWQAYKNREKTGPWGLRMLYGTTVLCTGLVIYSLLFK